MHQTRLSGIFIAAALAGMLLVTSAIAGPRYEFDFAYRALYESNIYHAFLDSQALGGQLNELSLRGAALVRQGQRLTHQFTLYSALDLYPSYSNRNRTAFGGVYEPSYKYGKNSLVSLSVDLSRRDRDVLSDAGEPLARTLQKTAFDLSLNHRFSRRAWRTEQSLGYTDQNYEDSFDSLGTRLTSYDYHAWYGGIDLRYRLTRVVRPKVGFAYEKRYYSERKTYPVAKGPVRGYGVIRNYGEYVIDGGLELDFSRRVQIVPLVAYTNRRDNFENFYGYSEWKYGVLTDFQLSRQLELQCGFDFRKKDYPNYWTKNTGKLQTVAIEYATFDFEARYALSPTVSLFAYSRNFNKVSNEHYYPGLSVPSFDYQDFTAGFGAQFKL